MSLSPKLQAAASKTSSPSAEKPHQPRQEMPGRSEGSEPRCVLEQPRRDVDTYNVGASFATSQTIPCPQARSRTQEANDEAEQLGSNEAVARIEKSPDVLSAPGYVKSYHTAISFTLTGSSFYRWSLSLGP
jgi:hypothetical protein